ncbi:MAG: hypothetical protein Q8Q37_01900 [bacterium]|nr:hypothetical protein [bacterium]
MIVPLYFLVGCSGVPSFRPQVFTNIPYQSTTVAVINGTDGMVDVVQDGDVVRQNLGPGGIYKVVLRNFSGSSAYTSVAVIGHEGNAMTGTAYRQFYVSGYDRRSEVWTVQRWDLRK